MQRIKYPIDVYVIHAHAYIQGVTLMYSSLLVVVELPAVALVRHYILSVCQIITLVPVSAV